jgi:phosphoribosylanthranilate isomerase
VRERQHRLNLTPRADHRQEDLHEEDLMRTARAILQSAARRFVLLKILVRAVARVKICGVTNAEDARMCALEGADAIGINFVPSSPRRVSEDEARAIADAVRDLRVLVVGVVADLSPDAMIALRDRVGLGCLQLHGDEPPEALARLVPHAYKAIRVATAADVARADAYGGDYLLVDAKLPGTLGGTGTTFDWSLVTELAKRRKLTLAGGLHEGNVAEAIRVVSPYCVDVASGVEVPGEPRKKDPSRVRAFVTRAKTDR